MTVGIGVGGISREWDVDCMDTADGKLTSYRLSTMWDPKKDGTLEAVARTGAAMLSCETNRKHIAQGAPRLLTGLKAVS